MMNRRAITSKEPIDHNVYQIRPNQSMVAETIYSQKSQQNSSTDFLFQIQTTSVVSNPIVNKTETFESIPSSEATGISLPFSSTLLPGFKIPLQINTKSNWKQFM